MENFQKVDSFQFEVDKTTVDKLHRMRPSALCNMMLACAGRHADARGFGATRKLGWVMARMVLDIKEIPLGSQIFTIETFIKNAYRGFTDRCIRAVDENGKELGKIAEVLDYPGNKVYVVQGEHEYMIPAVKQFVQLIDIDNNIMQVKTIEGMRIDES